MYTLLRVGGGQCVDELTAKYCDKVVRGLLQLSVFSYEETVVGVPKCIMNLPGCASLVHVPPCSQWSSGQLLP